MDLAIEDLEQDAGLICRQMGRKGLESIENVGPRLAQVGEKGLDFRRTHVLGMAFVVQQDVARDPADVGLFGAVGVMFQAQGVAHLVQKSLGCWLWFHSRFP